MTAWFNRHIALQLTIIGRLTAVLLSPRSYTFAHSMSSSPTLFSTYSLVRSFDQSELTMIFSKIIHDGCWMPFGTFSGNGVSPTDHLCSELSCNRQLNHFYESLIDFDTNQKCLLKHQLFHSYLIAKAPALTTTSIMQLPIVRTLVVYIKE